MSKDCRYFLVFVAFFVVTLQTYGCGGSGGSVTIQTPQTPQTPQWTVYSVGNWGGVRQVEDASIISDSTSEEICALRNTRKAIRSFELSGRFSLPNGINIQGVSFVKSENQAIPEVCFRDENSVQPSFCAHTYAELPIINGGEHEIVATNGRTYYASFDTGVNGYVFINRFSSDIANKASLYYYLATESVHIASMAWGQESLIDKVFNRAINMGCSRRKNKPKDVPKEEPVNNNGVGGPKPGGGGPKDPSSGGGPVNPNS